MITILQIRAEVSKACLPAGRWGSPTEAATDDRQLADNLS